MLIFLILASWKTRDHSIKQDQLSSEDTAKKPSLDHIQPLMNNGAQPLERPIWTQITEANQTLFKS